MQLTRASSSHSQCPSLRSPVALTMYAGTYGFWISPTTGTEGWGPRPGSTIADQTGHPASCSGTWHV